MDDLLKEFLTETAESLEVLDGELVKLEQDPNDPELLGNIFRLVHTIKGTCGFLGLPRLEAVAHAGENILGKFRDGELLVTPDAVSLILEALDCIKGLLGALEATEAEPEGDDSALIGRLNAFASGKPVAAAVAPAGEEASASEPAPAVEAPAAEAPMPAGGTLYEQMGGLGVLDAVVEVFFDHMSKDEFLKNFFKNTDLDRLRGGERAHLARLLGGPTGGDEPRNIFHHLASRGLGESNHDVVAEHLREALETLDVHQRVASRILTLVAADVQSGGSDAEGEDTAAALAPAAEKSAAAAEVAGGPAEKARGESNVAANSIRVNVDLLENLMTMVSELVLTRNQLLQILRVQKESDFAAPLQRLNHVTSELQEGVMRTRMQPIGNAWAKLPRLVRDLSRELGKKIDLTMVGAETELDRQVLEIIKDPLTHMVRNSADHGLETPKEREKSGKPETGTIRLEAYHEGGHIVIAIGDDGRGLAIDKIKAKAVANGLHTEAELEGMSDQQVMQLIFRPGFSTADKVTSVSGRGVGMDVVKTNIEKIGGVIDIKSTLGKGSTFTVKIPLTLAIVSALIVEAAGERFAIPQISVSELVRASAKSEYKIEFINGAPVLRLRNRLLPLVSLGGLLQLETPEEVAAKSHQEAFIVVAQLGAASLGIIVDKVFDTEEIVVKPVAPILRDIQIYSGNTILGDGSVVMILDPNGIASAASDLIATEEDMLEAERREGVRNDRIALLVFRAGDKTPKAVPLSLVARLEEIDVTTVEISDGQPVVQYRGQLMPLIAVGESQSLREKGRQPVIVFSDRHRSMGLIVDEIVDIVEDRLNVELTGSRPGLLGSAVVGGQATEIIDTGHYLTRAYADWFKNIEQTDGECPSRRILLVDDSPFFRNLLTPLLSVAGYDVTSVESADRALNLYEAGENFDIIISDIEMPGMDGFEFAEAVKSSARWQDVPLVALSSHTSPSDLDRGREVGFTDYVAKFDRDALLHTISETLAQNARAA
ncbi:MAG TPA: chemotaxis protein CheW [Alphaproteobacteria bacterium]|nr:chemotaxis protein CheW [Alphaproteobacteria bacterium]